MNKQEFLEELCKGLCGLPSNDIDEHISFYGEMIDDRIEEGLTEEEAITEFGDIDEIIFQILNDIPLTKIVKEKIKKRISLPAWAIILIIIGSPIWLSILVSLLSAVLSVYISLWAGIISLWAVAIALGATTFGLLVYTIITIIQGNVLSGIALLACSCVVSGVSIYFDYGCKWATKGMVILTKKLPLWIKMLFIKREEA